MGSLNKELGHDGVLNPHDLASSSFSRVSITNSPSLLSESPPSIPTVSMQEERNVLVNRDIQRIGLEDGQVIQSHLSPTYPIEQLPSLTAPDNAETAAPQVIKVTIGRIDVRANHIRSQAPTASRTIQQQGLSLEDYLRKHPGDRS